MRKDITIRQKIYLGALLHDIGKFYQRADKGFSDKYNELSAFSKNIAEGICPINEQGRFGYQHVVWTNEFFEKFNSKIEQIPGVKENRYTSYSVDNIVTFACNHHKPQSLLQSFVTIGDWWSAGIDRRDVEKIKGETYVQKSVNWGKYRYKVIPLFSVFNTVNPNNKEDIKASSSAFMLKPLSIDRQDIFTKKINKEEDGISEKDYKTLWDKFVEEFEDLPTDNIVGFSESLLYLLKKYTWCIPSNTMDMANVSLFEHLKTTAAFAESIYSYYIDGNEDKFSFNKQYNRLTLKGNVHPVMLVGGDISGIQKFIYNIASQKAAVSLKGRSFYVQLLIDSIIQKIITHQDIQATIGHVVYSSGGKFYMILPNTQKVITALENIKTEIEKELWEEHKGKLSVNLSSVGFALVRDIENKISIESENENKNLGDLWRHLAEKLNTQKSQKYMSLLNNKFFEIQKVGGDVKMCAVTGEELVKENRAKLDGTEVYVSNAVFQQTKLGIALKDADCLITYREPKDESKYLSNRSKAYIKVVGVDNYMFDQKELAKDDADFRKITSADVSRIMLFNNTNPLMAKLKGSAVSYGFQFYGGNKQACYLDQKGEKQNKTFRQLVQSDKGESTYLGVLKMDVDGLGNIFINGFKEEEKSFAAYATMSFQLDLFFSGYINSIRNSDKYKDFVNILYSGGDDVFAVGRWDLLIDFAADIRKDFAAFIGRDDISISGGISIVRNKYPIAKVAELAGEAEDASKEYNNDEKNAISFLGETISWKLEYEYVKKYKKDFVRLYDKGDGISKSLLHKLMQFYEIEKGNQIHRDKGEENKVDLSYKWNSVYYLKRFKDRYKFNKDRGNEKDKGNEVICNFINQIQIDLFENELRLIALAARWAELEIREINY